MDFITLFKALADEKRIRIVALISERELSVEEIASAVELTAATVSHHLSVLRQAGLVEARREQYYTMYRFRQQPLLDALKALSEKPAVAVGAAGDDPLLERYDAKVLQDYLVDGKLKTIPAQRKKRDVILRFLADKFMLERDYAEREVNLVIADYHDDFATLRRELIMSQMLQRENGIYRRTESGGRSETEFQRDLIARERSAGKVAAA